MVQGAHGGVRRHAVDRGDGSGGPGKHRRLDRAAAGACDIRQASVLGTGVHLHWQLPDHFRRGAQSDAQSGVVFPPAPNRWLVIRYLRVHDGATGGYGAPTTTWIVESDHVHAGPPDWTPIIRSPPSPPRCRSRSGGDQQPYRFWAACSMRRLGSWLEIPGRFSAGSSQRGRRAAPFDLGRLRRSVIFGLLSGMLSVFGFGITILATPGRSTMRSRRNDE